SKEPLWEYCPKPPTDTLRAGRSACHPKAGFRSVFASQRFLLPCPAEYRGPQSVAQAPGVQAPGRDDQWHGALCSSALPRSDANPQSSERDSLPRPSDSIPGPGEGLRERPARSEEHTSELQSRGHLVCRLLLEKKKDTRPPCLGGPRKVHC